MSLPNQEAVPERSLRILRETTCENVDPKPSEELINLQNELALTTIDLQHANADVQRTTNQLVQANDKLQQIQLQLNREVDSMVMIVLEEMIRTIQTNHNKRKTKIQNVDNKQKKKRQRLL